MKKNPEYMSEQELFVAILERLDAIVKKMPGHSTPPVHRGFIDNAELLQLLKITDRTAGEWRRKGTLPFSKVHGKIYYRIEDIEKMISQKVNKCAPR